MVYTVNWASKIVRIPKIDLALVSASPEIRELDVIEFWQTIHDIQDGEGMPFRDIMRSNAPVTLAGVTYARSVEIINGYKIEFEDGEYQVNLTGANNNLLDARVQNNVSINASNSAGLVAGGGSGGLTPGQEAKLNQVHDLLYGRMETDPQDGKMKVYSTETGLIAHEAFIFSDLDGSEPFDASAPILRRNAFVPVP